MSNPIRDILYDMDLEFTSTIPMSDEQADEVYERYAKIVTKAVVDVFVERLKKETKESTSIVSVFNGKAGLVRHEKYILEDDIDRISSEYKGE